MPFAEPIINETGTYKALFHSDDSVPDSAATVEVILTTGEGPWTGEALDVLFQSLVNLIEGSPLFQFVDAVKAQNTSTLITPDPLTPEE